MSTTAEECNTVPVDAVVDEETQQQPAIASETTTNGDAEPAAEREESLTVVAPVMRAEDLPRLLRCARDRPTVSVDAVIRVSAHSKKKHGLDALPCGGGIFLVCSVVGCTADDARGLFGAAEGVCVFPSDTLPAWISEADASRRTLWRRPPSTLVMDDEAPLPGAGVLWMLWSTPHAPHHSSTKRRRLSATEDH